MTAHPRRTQLRRGEAEAWSAPPGTTAPPPRELFDGEFMTDQGCGSFRGNWSPKAACAASLRSRCRWGSSSSRGFRRYEGRWGNPPEKPQLDKDSRQRIGGAFRREGPFASNF